MRAILVSVDYSDLLSITLPHNRHHFEEVMVVTDRSDLAAVKIAQDNDCRVYRTNAFYEDGAFFNKWVALEQALDAYGRHGLMCIMDADVLWPESIDWPELKPTKLYGSLRHMLYEWPSDIPAERDWNKFPIHRNINEWAGYTQIFHADDPHLGNPPWHEIDWLHAGGADSFFQAKWPRPDRIRLFTVLHLGRAGKNWLGRTTPYADGSSHPEAVTRQQQLRQMLHERNGSFDCEKIK